MHDPRIGRFFAIDPLAPQYPHNSVYAFSENVVIDHVELEGLEKAPTAPPGEQPDGTTTAAIDGIGTAQNFIPELHYEELTHKNEFLSPLSLHGYKESFANSKRQAAIRSQAEFVEKLYGNTKILGQGTSALIVWGAAEIVSGEYFGAKLLKLGSVFKAYTSSGSIGGLMHIQRGISYGDNFYGAGRLINNHRVNYFKGLKNCAGCAMAGDATLKGHPSSALNHGVTNTGDFLNHFGVFSWDTALLTRWVYNRMYELIVVY